MKALFLIGLVVLILGVVSLVVPIPHSEKSGVSVGGVSLGVETRHEEKDTPRFECGDDSGRVWCDGRRKEKNLLTIIVKERKPKQEGLTRRFLRTRVFKILISLFVLFSIASSTVVTHYYNRYARIIDLKLGREVFQHTAKIYAASPKLVTNLSDASRAKRRLVEFKDLPKVLVDAVTAGEDQSFFSSSWAGSYPNSRRIHLES